MPHPSYSRNDPYLKRLGVAAGVGFVAVVVGTLLGPSTETVQRWILDEHIGAEGPTEILPKIDIIPDEAEVKQDPLEHMSSATQGLQVEEELSKPIPDAEKSRPESAEQVGRSGYAPLNLLDSTRPSPTPASETRPELHTRSLTSDDFVLEFYVEPSYPEGAGGSARTRIIVVEAGLYIEPSGLVSHAVIHASNGGRLFDEAVLDAIRQWRFRPIVDEPESFWSHVTFRFNLDEMTPRVEMESGR